MGFGLRVSGSGIRAPEFGFRVSGFGFRVQGSNNLFRLNLEDLPEGPLPEPVDHHVLLAARGRYLPLEILSG